VRGQLGAQPRGNPILWILRDQTEPHARHRCRGVDKAQRGVEEERGHEDGDGHAGKYQWGPGPPARGEVSRRGTARKAPILPPCILAGQ
jgi:hypothetical protein